ncbi:glycosyltransferase family 2 protein [Cochlodiniinecator piscidefendens]|uniref:glycosyltransferase family 2 protein n=1 Tax=Cochlodiniinecator piscidefendens TaxID=2715756 RepID=UPI001409EC10|nr:glycosyltransferase family 2 protein [Cochlodiniinecator piscidefendens]
MARYVLVATMKNEGPHLLEWVAHHKRLGFDDIIIFQNGSTDFTDRSLQVMDKAGIVQYHLNEFRPNFQNPPYQNRALRRASHTEAYQNADWCIGLDGDEFLHIKTPEGTLDSLVSAVEQRAGEVDEIRLNWRLFGNSFLDSFDERMMTERFTWADRDDLVTTRMIPVKTLFRTKSFLRPGIHLPKEPQKETLRFSNGSGLPQEAFETSGFRSLDPGQRAFAQINHYAVRDIESFLLKSARGSASNVGRQVNMQYWNRFNYNQVEDTGLRDLMPKTVDEMAVLDDLTNGRLMGIRRRSFRQWRVGVRQLREEPEFAKLHRRLASQKSQAA